MGSSTFAPRGIPLPSPVRDRLSRYVERVGEHEAVAALGISRNALARALGGLRLYGTTRNLIRDRLDRIEATR